MTVHGRPAEGEVVQLYRRLGPIDRQQMEIWRKMSPAQRLELAFQAYQFALEIVRVTERRAHPNMLSEDLNWHITRRMQGDQSLGR